LKKRIPAISLDTVCRTLRLFVQEGIISRVSAAGGSRRSDGNTERHHRFIFITCGLVQDDSDSLTAPDEVTAWGG
jgi:Fur family peroxide stress response transcriptional regulator